MVGKDVHVPDGHHTCTILAIHNILNGNNINLGEGTRTTRRQRKEEKNKERREWTGCGGTWKEGDRERKNGDGTFCLLQQHNNSRQLKSHTHTHAHTPHVSITPSSNYRSCFFFFSPFNSISTSVCHRCISLYPSHSSNSFHALQ